MSTWQNHKDLHKKLKDNMLEIVLVHAEVWQRLSFQPKTFETEEISEKSYRMMLLFSVPNSDMNQSHRTLVHNISNMWRFGIYDL